MRENLPVTQQQYIFPADYTLVSVTDTKGRITYCNPAFVEISGFNRAELLGQPHNLVRHPDMPEEAFRDMWDTIQSGLPWTGIVKNRRKNGDHYWVQANATPMRDGEEITGYLSVRTVPAATAVAAAETLYSRMRSEQEAGRLIHVLHHGQVRRKSLAGRIAQWMHPSASVRLGLTQLVLTALLVCAVVMGLPVPQLVGACLIAGALACWSAWSMAIRPLTALVQDANHLAAGDLSHSVAMNGTGMVGQLQQALTQMSVNLRTVVSDVRSEIDQLVLAVQEISDGNNDLSARTESQASSLEQTAASMEQINGTAQQSAQAASRGSQLAQQTTQVATRSNDAVQSWDPLESTCRHASLSIL